MSTPSGGSRDPIDLSAYVSHRARAATEREAAESDERDDHAIDTTFEQDVPAEHAEDADTAASPRPARAASSAPQEQPAAERRDGIMSDGDLERLEASLRWLQRQETATRPPRAGQLPPSPRLAPFDASRRRYGGERYATAIRAPLSLEPERLAPPPASARNLSEPLGILVVSILAAAIGYVGYHVAAGGWSRSPPPAPRPQQAAFDRTPVAPPPSSRSRQDPRPAMARGDDGGTLSEVSLQRTEPLQSATPTAGETILLQPGETGVQAPPPRQAIRTLDPGEIELFKKQGEQFAATGDLVTARVVLQRAAEAGDAEAAVALGATYDPEVLSKLGAVGISADVERARSWYQKAESFGSSEAARRLAVLANR